MARILNELVSINLQADVCLAPFLIDYTQEHNFDMVGSIYFKTFDMC